MLHVVRSAQITYTARKSRFIAQIETTTTRAEVDDALARVRDTHPDSSHVVYAFLLGDENSELAGLSDDGEPHGTAGRPVMAVLRGSGIRNALLTVVRYFGGTKLGTGGLVDAYGTAAKEAIQACGAREHHPSQEAYLHLDYATHESIQRRLTELGCTILEEQYAERVTMHLRIPDTVLQEVIELVRDATGGQSALEFAEGF